MVDFNYLKLGFTIFISVLFAGLILFFIEQNYYSNVFERFTSSIPKSIASIKLPSLPSPIANINTTSVQSQTTDNLIKLQQESRRQQKKLRSEALARKSIQNTNDETCSFWRERYSKNKHDYNKVNMNSACKRAAND